RRGHPAHRLLHRRHLRDGGEDAPGRGRFPGHAGHLLRRDRPAHPGPWRGRGAAAPQPDPDRCGPGNRQAQAAADLHPERDRADLLRDHPAQGQRGFRRRQLPGAVREHRTRPRAPRRALTSIRAGARRREGRARASGITARQAMNAAHDHSYMTGFGNEFASEAIAGTLPQGQNSPQRVAHGLYAEQISGTAFTAPRAQNRRSWLYRIRPAAVHGSFEAFVQPRFHNAFGDGPVTPEQLRWDPLPLPVQPVDFIESLYTVAGNGSAAAQAGVAIHLYAADRDMAGRYFYDADGELLLVPQQGRLRIATELGVIEVEPQQVALVPRGIRFRVELPDGAGRGYVLENFGAHMRLPDLGPIGSNGLANPRDFQAPVAAYEDLE